MVAADLRVEEVGVGAGVADLKMEEAVVLKAVEEEGEEEEGVEVMVTVLEEEGGEEEKVEVTVVAWAGEEEEDAEKIEAVLHRLVAAQERQAKTATTMFRLPSLD